MRAAVLLVLLAVGCGPGGPVLHPAGGVVTFRGGKPVTGGLVEFTPADGGPSARAKLNPDGTFTLLTDDQPGAVAGKHRVVVLPMVVADGAPIGHRHKAGLVHPKHGRYDTSGLTAAVEPGRENRFVFEVEPAP